jgi:hypothetical protein
MDPITYAIHTATIITPIIAVFFIEPIKAYAHCIKLRTCGVIQENDNTFSVLPKAMNFDNKEMSFNCRGINYPCKVCATIKLIQKEMAAGNPVRFKFRINQHATMHKGCSPTEKDQYTNDAMKYGRTTKQYVELIKTERLP